LPFFIREVAFVGFSGHWAWPKFIPCDVKSLSPSIPLPLFFLYK